MLQNDFNYMIKQFGVDIFLNEETKPRKAIISSKNTWGSLDEHFDDRLIHTAFPIKRGDYIEYNTVNFIVYSDVQVKRGHEYKAIIRPATNTIPIVVKEREIIGRDPLNNPIYSDEPEITKDIPAIVYTESLTIAGYAVLVAQGEIRIVVGDNKDTRKIKVNNEYVIKNKNYKVWDINFLQDGLIILRASINNK